MLPRTLYLGMQYTRKQCIIGCSNRPNTPHERGQGSRLIAMTYYLPYTYSWSTLVDRDVQRDRPLAVHEDKSIFSDVCASVHKFIYLLISLY